MKDILLFAAILIGWIALNRWILPMFGIQTCMSGACAQVPQHPEISTRKPAAKADVNGSQGNQNSGFSE